MATPVGSDASQWDTPARQRQRLTVRLNANRWALQRAASRLQRGHADAAEDVARCKEDIERVKSQLEEL